MIDGKCHWADDHDWDRYSYWPIGDGGCKPDADAPDESESEQSEGQLQEPPDD